MKSCYIFSAALGFPESFEPKEADLIIAADAGFLKLKEMGLAPHLAVGDFDSLKEIPKGSEVIKHPVRKDDTDTMLGVKIGLERGYKSFYLYGCSGLRLDHTLANLQTLVYIAKQGGRGYLQGEDFVATAISEDTLLLPERTSGTVSVFSATTESEISIEGLLYPLNHATLTCDFPLGVSNEFIGRKSKITAHKGTVIIIINNPKPLM